MSEITAAVERYYSGRIREHGATPLGVDWNGERGQVLRFERLLDATDGVEGPLTLLDWGCGYGALVDLLRERRPDARYVGYDLSAPMVEEGRRRYAGDEGVRFTTDIDALDPVDVTVASGVFNVRLQTPEDRWRGYVLETLDQMAALSRRGVAFNALTSHSDADRMRQDLHYADPAALLDHCLRRYSRDVALRHDYALYEFTLVVRLGGRPPVSPG